MLLREQERGVRVAEHEGQALLRIGRVERNVSSTAFEDTEQTHQHIQRTLNTQTHQRCRTDTLFAQIMCQGIGPPIHLAIAEGRTGVDNGDSIGSAGCLLLEEGHEALGWRIRDRGRVPLDE